MYIKRLSSKRTMRIVLGVNYVYETNQCNDCFLVFDRRTLTELEKANEVALCGSCCLLEEAEYERMKKVRRVVIWC